MGYELFTNKKASFKDPTVTILKSGGFFFNNSCYDKYLSKANFINLLFDKEENRIGLHLSDKKENYSYPIRHSDKRAGFGISAKSFLKFFEIEYEAKSVTYNASWDESSKILEVDLNKS